MTEEYVSISQTATGEIVEKKSRFIATIMHIESENEALEQINLFNKKYWDATHNCYAFVIGFNNEIERFNDDGEPSGTAGMPILEVLRGAKLRNVIIIVTRYFGGTLLGTGGLVRAYTDASREAVSNAVIEKHVWCKILQIKTDYNMFGKLQYFFEQEGIIVENIEYTEEVILTVAAELERFDYVNKSIINLTNGMTIPVIIEERYVLA